MTAAEPALSLTAATTIDTDTGAVTIGQQSTPVAAFMVDQGTEAPGIRVLVVGSLSSQAPVTVTGSKALAIVSDGEVRIADTFSLSALGQTGGPGSFSVPACEGQSGGFISPGTRAGGGGAGFGEPGAMGGGATSTAGSVSGGSGGGAIGNPALTPLRGGCSGGFVGGGGGGAIQIVSRTRIVVAGVLAANGAAGGETVGAGRGGGSGGGILLEAPAIEISGNVVANGAGGNANRAAAEDGRNDAVPAAGGDTTIVNAGDGGNGGAGTTPARPGSPGMSTTSSTASGGGGGGGVGRIRVNTTTGGLDATGVFSPPPRTGSIAVR